ncbi:hypothetical protein ZIOFF_037551 [Zingiber officinale]|uniref:Uncharacterized protein n=1 Tax=Zingiber officinale TaxID=94328 RepID=A0A8J5L478_ZINOF|nr:hypothetical protein ZIOFF_037551 [Zingiber officinale]
MPVVHLLDRKYRFAPDANPQISCLGRFASLDGLFLAIGRTLPSIAVGGSGTLATPLIDSPGGVWLEILLSSWSSDVEAHSWILRSWVPY